MDLDHIQPVAKGSDSGLFPAKPADDQKELAWALLGLLLWSGVVLVAVFGAGYVVGHSLLHLW